MKTILIIIATACSLTGLMAQTLEPLLDTTKRWTDISFSTAKDIKAGHTSTYKLSGMVEISGQDYFKLWVSERDLQVQNWLLKGYIRETPEGKVYLKELNQNMETLLYDFGMQAGDSLVYNEYQRIYIDSVAFHEFAGETRKFLYCHNLYYPELATIVEGIGAIDLGFINILYIGLIGAENHLLCFEQNNELLYHNQVNYGEGIIEGCYYDEDGYPWDPILNTEKRWTDLNLSDSKKSFLGRTTSYKIGSTTVTINGKIYHILYQSNDSLNQNWSINGYIRAYSDKMVYYLKKDTEYETLLYNNKITLNDSLNFGGNGIIITSRAYLIYGYRYRWHWYGHTFPLNRPDTIIEGIGSVTSGFLGVLHAGLGNNSNHLLCFSENNQLLYHCPMNIVGSGVIEGCYFNNTDIEPFISEERGFQIVPNPVESTGIIKIKENQMFPLLFEVFTLDGIKAIEEKIYKPEQEISFFSLSTGIYICRIKLNDKILTSKLLLK